MTIRHTANVSDSTDRVDTEYPLHQCTLPAGSIVVMHKLQHMPVATVADRYLHVRPNCKLVIPLQGDKSDLDAQQGGIDYEVAAFVEDGVGLGCFRVCQKVLLTCHSPTKVDGLQIVQLRLASLQLVGCC